VGEEKMTHHIDKKKYVIIRLNKSTRMCEEFGSYETIEEAQKQANKYATANSSMSYIWTWFVEIAEKERRNFRSYRPLR
jgi:hypothetical protein